MAKKYLIFYDGHVREVVNDKFTVNGVEHSVAALPVAEAELNRVKHNTVVVDFKKVATPIQKRYGIPNVHSPYRNPIDGFESEMNYGQLYHSVDKNTPSEVLWYASREKKYPFLRGVIEAYVIDANTPKERRVVQDGFLNKFYANNNNTIPQDADQMVFRFEYREIPLDKALKKPDGSESCESARAFLLERGKEEHKKKLKEAKFGGLFQKKNPTDEELMKLGYKNSYDVGALVEPIIFSLFPGRKPIPIDEIKKIRELIDGYAYKTSQEAKVNVSIAKGNVNEVYSTEPILLAPYLFGPNAVDNIENPNLDSLHTQIGYNNCASCPLECDTTMAALKYVEYKSIGDFSFYSAIKNPAGPYYREFSQNPDEGEYFLGQKYRVRTAVLVAGLRALMLEEGARLFDQIPEITMKNIEGFSVEFTPGAAKHHKCVETFAEYGKKISHEKVGDLVLQFDTETGKNIPGYMETLENFFSDAETKWATKVDARELDFESLIYEFSQYKLRLPMISLMKSLASAGTKRAEKLDRMEKAVERLVDYYGGELSYRIRHKEFSVTREEYEADVAFEKYMAEAEDYLEPEDYYFNRICSAPEGKLDRIREKMAEKVERDRRILEREKARKVERMSRPVGTYECACDSSEYSDGSESDYDEK